MATFVSADWVSERIGDPAYLVIDPRSAMRYLMGHLRTAVSVPYKKMQGADGGLGPPEQLAAVFGGAGLADDTVPVLYDHQDGRNAAMAAWVLELLGRDDVHIMDLLYESWKEQGREVLYRPVVTKSKSFTPRLDPSIRAEIGDVANRSGVTLLDTRTLEEFRGEAEMDDRPGHIPGAVHLPHSELTGQNGRLLLDKSLLDHRLSAAGITPGDPVIAYCRSGVRASVSYLAMKHAGYNVRLYDGSYSEWMDSGHPVEI